MASSSTSAAPPSNHPPIPPEYTSPILIPTSLPFDLATIPLLHSLLTLSSILKMCKTDLDAACVSELEWVVKRLHQVRYQEGVAGGKLVQNAVRLIGVPVMMLGQGLVWREGKEAEKGVEEMMTVVRRDVGGVKEELERMLGTGGVGVSLPAEQRSAADLPIPGQGPSSSSSAPPSGVPVSPAQLNGSLSPGSTLAASTVVHQNHSPINTRPGPTHEARPNPLPPTPNVTALPTITDRRSGPHPNDDPISSDPVTAGVASSFGGTGRHPVSASGAMTISRRTLPDSSSFPPAAGTNILPTGSSVPNSDLVHGGTGSQIPVATLPNQEGRVIGAFVRNPFNSPRASSVPNSANQASGSTSSHLPGPTPSISENRNLATVPSCDNPNSSSSDRQSPPLPSNGTGSQSAVASANPSAVDRQPPRVDRGKRRASPSPAPVAASKRRRVRESASASPDSDSSDDEGSDESFVPGNDEGRYADESSSEEDTEMMEEARCVEGQSESGDGSREEEDAEEDSDYDPKSNLSSRAKGKRPAHRPAKSSRSAKKRRSGVYGRRSMSRDSPRASGGHSEVDVARAESRSRHDERHRELVPSAPGSRPKPMPDLRCQFMPGRLWKSLMWNNAFKIRICVPLMECVGVLYQIIEEATFLDPLGRQTLSAILKNIPVKRWHSVQPATSDSPTMIMCSLLSTLARWRYWEKKSNGRSRVYYQIHMEMGHIGRILDVLSPNIVIFLRKEDFTDGDNSMPIGRFIFEGKPLEELIRESRARHLRRLQGPTRAFDPKNPVFYGGPP